MTIKGDELGPSHPVSDERLLLAIGRTADHQPPDKPRFFRSAIAAHLGFVHNGATTLRLRPQLEAFKEAGYLEFTSKRGHPFVRLTAKGRRRIIALRRRGGVPPLPESPQHRRWREATNLATDQFEVVLADLKRDLAEASAIPDALAPDIVEGRFTSDRLLWLGSRLNLRFRLLSTAVFCIFEWDEPTDDAYDLEGAGRYAALRIHTRGAEVVE
jgi:hypothetical protein